MAYTVVMYITSVPNRTSPPTVLLRESYREEGQVKTRTLANLTKLPDEAIALLKRHLGGERFLSSTEAFQTVYSWHHGHVKAVRLAMKQLGFDRLISTRPSRERDLVIAMVAARILEPGSKLATTRWWKNTTLPQTLGVEEADETELYGAMDWLYSRQEQIETKLAKRHLHEDGLVLYDLSSSYFEGCCCPQAARGHNRDKKQSKLQVNYGLLTDARGCPVSVSVFDGNVSDTKTLLPQVEKIQQQFGIQKLVLTGDRGMITQTHIDQLKKDPNLDWITALKNGAIRKLVNSEAIQLDLFDERNLFELGHPDYPDERLIACRNPALAERRARKRQSLLEATSKCLTEIQELLKRGKLHGEEQIRKRVQRIIGPSRMDEHFQLTIAEDALEVELTDPLSAATDLQHHFTARMEKLRSQISRGKLSGSDKIAHRLNRLARQFRLTQTITFEVRDEGFEFHLADPSIAFQEALSHLQDELHQLRQLVEWGRYGGQDKIGVRLGKVIDKYKMGKHFVLDIEDAGFTFAIDDKKVAAEAALDGLYVIRTSTDKDRMSADDAVRSYKSLSQVERAFRTIKTVDLKVRPIHHYLEPRVRTHLFLCMLAYYVEWHMREAWRPLLFSDEDQEAKATRDPVAPAQRSEAARKKVDSKHLDDGTEAHSFRTLIQSLATIVLNIAYVPGMGTDQTTFEIVTTPNKTQQNAFDLLGEIGV